MTYRTILTGAALAAGLLFANAASAAPMSVPAPAVAGENGSIVHAGMGCPFGLVPSPYGCVRPARRHPFGYRRRHYY